MAYILSSTQNIQKGRNITFDEWTDLVDFQRQNIGEYFAETISADLETTQQRAKNMKVKYYDKVITILHRDSKATKAEKDKGKTVQKQFDNFTNDGESLVQEYLNFFE